MHDRRAKPQLTASRIIQLQFVQQPAMGEQSDTDEALAPLLLRLRLPGTEAMALVGVCRTRALKHQQEQEQKQEGGQEQPKDEGDQELAEAAREVSANCGPIDRTRTSG